MANIRKKSEYEAKGTETTSYPSEFDNADYGKKRKAKTHSIVIKNTTSGQVYGYKTIAEGDQTVYPNAYVVTSKRGKDVGEVYQDKNGWGCFHYALDSGADGMDSRDHAFEELVEMHTSYLQNRGNYGTPSIRPMESMTFLDYVQLDEMASKWKVEFDDGTSEEVIADDRQHAKLKIKATDKHIKKITRLELNVVEEATKDEDTRLPTSVISEITGLIRKGAKDLEQQWKNAFELTNTAYHVANVKRPTPDQKGGWKQYEDLLKIGVKALADARGMSGKWRMSQTAFAEAAETPELDKVLTEATKDRQRRIFVRVKNIGYDDTEQEHEVNADHISDVIHSIQAHAKRQGRHLHIEPLGPGHARLTVHVKGVTGKRRDEQVIHIKDLSA